MRLRFVLLVFLAVYFFITPAAFAENGAVTGLPLPRFATLKSEEVNVRTGPGKRYPIDWIFTRENMPVEIVAEYDTWRKIRDWQGVEGWVHQAMLSGRRSVLVTQDGFMLRREPAYNAAPVVKLKATITGELETCQNGWCQINVAGFKGWIHHDYIWGVSQEEAFKAM
jgi:SH3-like domain-containing protein